MTEDDKLIIGGMITILLCVIAIIVLTIGIEKNSSPNTSKWLSYLVMFSVGLLFLFIWPFPDRDTHPFIITIPTLIGMSFAVLTPVAFLVAMFIRSDLKIAQRMIEEAVLMGKALNLKTNGIPEDKKTPFHKLYFYYTGLIQNAWPVVHYDEEVKLRPSNSNLESQYNNHYAYPKDFIKNTREYARYKHYNYYYVYKLTLNHNLETVISIVSKTNQNDEGYTAIGFQKLDTPFVDFNEHVVVYCKAGQDHIMSKLQDPSFRKLLIDHKEWFSLGFKLNQEKSQALIQIKSYSPRVGMFEFNLNDKFFKYHLEHKKAHLKFFAEFLTLFDQ